jgi:hypothetical protein
MSVIRVGSNSKYADGWDAVFGKGGGGRKAVSGKKPGKAAKKKVVTKTKARKPSKSRRG